MHATIAGTNTFTGVTTYNSTNFQQNAATILTNFTNGGAFANNVPLAWDGGVNAGSGNFVVSSTANVDDWSNQGTVTVNSGGLLNNSQASLVNSGGAILTVMPGGQINVAADGGGETLDLHGSLLVNNGTINGLTNVYYGSLAEGAGTYGPVHVFQGGSFSPSNLPGTVLLNGDLIADTGAGFAFNLSGVNDSGLILMPNNTLALGGQDFDNFSFATEPDFGPGTYTLIEAQAISGSLRRQCQRHDRRPGGEHCHPRWRCRAQRRARTFHAGAAGHRLSRADGLGAAAVKITGQRGAG